MTTTTMNAPDVPPRRNFARRAAPLLFAVAFFAVDGATAQDKGSVNPEPLPPLAKPNDPATPAKELFGRKTAPAQLETRTIGFYAKGCLAGGMALPINGTTWQVMRLSRNRNWGHPNLVQFLEQLADQAPKTGWRGLMVGDMSQPRGGPMITGHASHQVGLDADIWLTPMPDRELTRVEREEMSATMVVAEDRKDVDPKVWKHDGQFAVIKASAICPASSLACLLLGSISFNGLKLPGEAPPPTGKGSRITTFWPMARRARAVICDSSPFGSIAKTEPS